MPASCAFALTELLLGSFPCASLERFSIPSVLLLIGTVLCRGIDVVRNKIKMFAQKKVTLPPGRHKVILLDEADRSGRLLCKSTVPEVNRLFHVFLVPGPLLPSCSYLKVLLMTN